MFDSSRYSQSQVIDRRFFLKLLGLSGITTVAFASGCDRSAAASIDGVRSAAVGDVVEFGVWEQDGDASTKPEPIEWLVLDEKASHRLLLSKYALTASAFSDENSCAWSNSLVREWLNGTFLETAFSDDQRNAIQQTGVANPKNEEYGTSGGVATIDYVFLLSIDEAKLYFENEGERLCLPTQTALNDGVRIRKNTGCCHWLLRSPGMSQGKGNGVTEGETAYSAYVGNDGCVYPSGYPVTLGDSGIRPALWV